MERIKLGLRKLLNLRPSDWADLFAAQAALLHAQLLVWTRPRGTLVSPRPAADSVNVDSQAVRAGAQRSALAISRAARYGVFRPACLVRAVALHGLLRRRGFGDSALRIGVRKEQGKLFAHAWVQCGGTVLADEEWHVKQFDELGRMGVSQPS